MGAGGGFPCGDPTRPLVSSRPHFLLLTTLHTAIPGAVTASSPGCGSKEPEQVDKDLSGCVTCGGEGFADPVTPAGGLPLKGAYPKPCRKGLF